ncbi:MAG: hypothetical protein GY953_32230 [bacterium]|nr:hypothetical protein [bacterium]
MTSKSQLQTMYLSDPVRHTADCPPFQIALRGRSSDEVAALVDAAKLNGLASLAGSVPFRPEVQIRDDRVAAYTADRNFDPRSMADLEKLVDFTSRAANMIGS